MLGVYGRGDQRANLAGLLSWAGTGSDRAGEVGLIMLILADVVGNYRKAGMP